MLSEPPSPLEFLQAVESGEDVRDALRAWHKRRTGALRIMDLREQLFQPERQSSASLRSTSVLRAIAREREASHKRRLQRVRLQPLDAIEEPETMMIPIPCVLPDTGYHVVIEKSRAFSLKMTEPEATTLSLMNVASRRCREITGYWPTCILVKMERFFKIECSMRYFVIEGVRIPFDCAESSAEYDVMAVYSELTDADEWTRDRRGL